MEAPCSEFQRRGFAVVAAPSSTEQAADDSVLVAAEARTTSAVAGF
jgi:hypothetical protein